MSLTEDQYDGIREMIRQAFIQGAKDVHENYHEEVNPDFSEAAYDYTAHVTDQFLAMFAPDQSAELASMREENARLRAEGEDALKLHASVASDRKVLIDEAAKQDAELTRLRSLLRECGEVLEPFKDVTSSEHSTEDMTIATVTEQHDGYPWRVQETLCLIFYDLRRAALADKLGEV